MAKDENDAERQLQEYLEGRTPPNPIDAIHYPDLTAMRAFALDHGRPFQIEPVAVGDQATLSAARAKPSREVEQNNCHSNVQRLVLGNFSDRTRGEEEQHFECVEGFVCCGGLVFAHSWLLVDGRRVLDPTRPENHALGATIAYRGVVVPTSLVYLALEARGTGSILNSAALRRELVEVLRRQSGR